MYSQPAFAIERFVTLRIAAVLNQSRRNPRPRGPTKKCRDISIDKCSPELHSAPIAVVFRLVTNPGWSFFSSDHDRCESTRCATNGKDSQGSGNELQIKKLAQFAASVSFRSYCVDIIFKYKNIELNL